MDNVFILGSGTMGCDLAILCARAGRSVLLWHRADAQKAMTRFDERVSRYIQRGILSVEEGSRVRRLTSGTARLEESQSAAWIIESVVEVAQIKGELLGAVDRIRCPDSILVSNTSSLSLAEIAKPMTHRESFAGVHFFNPALKIPVVELATLSGTDPLCMTRLEGWLKELGKEPIRVKEGTGFVVNRLMIGLMHQAFLLWEEGESSAADIDRLAVGALGHPIGPLALADLVGLDVIFSIFENLATGIPDPRLSPPKSLRALVEQAKFGRKTGEGIYKYPQ